MTVVPEHLQPCRLCCSPLKPCFINLDEQIYMCTSRNCTFPLMESDLPKFISGPASEPLSVLDELAQEPFFAEIFGNVSSSMSNSQPTSRPISPPYSALSTSSEVDEEYLHVSVVNSVLISVLCMTAVENKVAQLKPTIIGSVFSELATCIRTSSAISTDKILQIISEKILLLRPENNVSLPVRLNQLMTRLVTDGSALTSLFRFSTTTNANCDICGFSQSWSSQPLSMQLKSFTSQTNMEEFTCVDPCSECGSQSLNVTTHLDKLSDVFVLCCHENASRAVSNCSSESSLFQDFNQTTETGESSRYCLTTIVKYDEHLHRIVVTVRRSSSSPISDVNNWMRFDSLQSFLTGRYSNPSEKSWLTSLPLLLIWQREEALQPWQLFDSPCLKALQSNWSIGGPQLLTHSCLAAPQKLTPSSRASSVSAPKSLKRPASKSFLLTPPTVAVEALKPIVPDRNFNIYVNPSASGSQFLKKSFERLAAHRHNIAGKKKTSVKSTGHHRAGSNSHVSTYNSSNTTGSTTYPSPTISSETKRSRLDTSGSQDGVDFQLL